MKASAWSPRFTAGVLCLIAIAGLATDVLAAEPEAASSPADQPYRLLIALHFQQDAAFTPFFVRSVQRQVRDLTRNAFGALAEVEVVDHHPLLDQLGHKRLTELTVTAAGFQPLLADGGQAFDKAFLFEVSFRSGQYVIQWRQLDGEVQQIAPVQERQTPQRQWVGKEISLAVTHDFAPVATITPTADRDKVQLEFRGAHLAGGKALARWLAEGCILQPFWKVQQGDGSVTQIPLPYTALKIERDGGYRFARVLTNLANPWLQSPRVVGFQAWKLHTQTGRFRLRLLDEATGAPLQNCSVYASSRGFEAISDADRLADPDARGWVVSSQPFERLAYIRISQGPGASVQFPLPITSDWCETACRVPIDAAAADKSDVERETNYLVDDVKAIQTGLSEHIREVNQLNGDKRYEEALRAAREALAYCEKHSPSAAKSMRDLSQRRQHLKLASSPSFAWLETQSQELDRQRQGLETLADNLQRIIERNDAQSRANVLIELANQAVREGNIDEALEKYALALGEQPDQAALQRKLQRLKAAWETKSPEQREARHFVYSVWNKAELTDLERLLPEAEKAFADLQAAGDYLSAGKMLKINERLVADCNHLVQQLAAQGGDADRQEHEKYVGLLERLAQLQQQAAAFCAAAADEEQSESPTRKKAGPFAAESSGPGAKKQQPRPAPSVPSLRRADGADQNDDTEEAPLGGSERGAR